MSDFSPEIIASPELKNVLDLEIELTLEGAYLNWSPVTGANSYRIYRSSNSTDDITQMELLKETTTTNWTDSGAIESDRYFYVVVVVAY